MQLESPKVPEDLTIFVPNTTEHRRLTDYRLIQRYGGVEFGRIGQVAKNLGISAKSEDGGLIFTGPKSRLQMFAEKLHFALIEFEHR